MLAPLQDGVTQSKVIDRSSRIHDIRSRCRLVYVTASYRHRRILGRCGVSRRRGGGLLGYFDVAAQGDAVVGVLSAGKQSILWRLFGAIERDHVAFEGNWLGAGCVAGRSRRGLGNLDRFVSGGEREKGVGWSSGLISAVRRQVGRRKRIPGAGEHRYGD